MHRQLLLWILFSVAFTVQAATSDGSFSNQLKEAATCLQAEQYDCAIGIYDSIILNDDASLNHQMEAWTGLLKLYVQDARVESADSLLAITDKLAEDPSLQPHIALKYQQERAEYERGFGDLQASLDGHLAVLEAVESMDPVNDSLRCMAYIYVGAAYEDLNQFEKALEYGERGYAYCLEVYGSSSLSMVSPTSIMGVIYYRQSNYDSSFVFYQRAIDLVQKHFDKPTSNLAILYGNYAATLNDYGQYESSIEMAEEAARINRSLGSEEGLGFNYFAMAASYFYLGDYGKASDYMHACLDVRSRVYPEGHRYRTSPKEVIGIAEFSRGNYKKGFHFLNQVLDSRKEAYGENSLPVGYTLENLALSFEDLGQIDSALVFMEKALAIYKETLPDVHLNLAHTNFNLARMHLTKGNLDEAYSFINRAIFIYLELGTENIEQKTLNFVVKARIESSKGDFQAAERSFEDAFEYLGRSPLTTYRAEEFPTTLTAWYVVNSYMEVLHEKNRAQPYESFENEMEQLRTLAFDIGERLRRKFNDPYTKQVIMTKGLIYTETGVSIHYDLLQRTSDQKHLNGLFQYAEYGRTNLYRDMIDDYKLKQFGSLPTELLAQEQSIKEQLSSLYEEQVEDPNNADIQKALFQTKQSYDSLINHFEEEYPRYYELKYQSDLVNIEQVQSELLHDDLTLLEYILDDTAYYVITVLKDEAQAHYLGNRTEIDQLVDDWTGGVSGIKQTLTMRSGNQLYQLLIEPIRSLLKEEVVIIPVGSLFRLSFEALNSSMDTESFMIYEHAIYYALSANVLLEQSKHEPSRTGEPIIIAPGFEEDIKSAYLNDEVDPYQRDSTFLTAVRQPWSSRLASRIAKEFNGLALLGRQASENEVKSNIENRHIIHFATHAIADHSDPLRSKFILAKGNDESEDGYLHAYEIYNLSLNSELAILAACESGTGRQQAGEGMISLAYSMNYAGCPSVIMSLWKIDERINNQIVYTFYSQLNKGLRKVDALREAKLQYLNQADRNMDHPFYWSGLVLMGEASELEMASSQFAIWKWLIIFGLCIFIAYIGFRTRG